MEEEAEKDAPEKSAPPEEPSFAETIGEKASQKLRARRQARNPVWAGLGLMGMVGWSVAVPTLIGAFVGRWLDDAYPENRSWTLVFLAAGLLLGCVNAWRWVAKENAFNRDFRWGLRRKNGRDGGNGIKKDGT